MNEKELKSSEEWIKLKNVESFPYQLVIQDAIGWKDKSWTIPISKIEFELRLAKSTFMYQNLHQDNTEENFHDHIPGRD